MFILLIFTSCLLPQDKGIYKTYKSANAQLTMRSDSIFEYQERKPDKIIDLGIWTLKSDSITFISNEITNELGRRFFDSNVFNG